ncbi:hypothetical protein HS041_28325 [Planomonospora sp. ID67723]|uniref:hypothetical protein n=1 Tax=Planomonospora sp. ID67723 TaxID=2738134 RepID=UPI0018C3B886|nr:hypothetical protein [Planomonospora sp. ID67723]MBG0831641.1 hypothetical protein [Planomonospora sp. ID67723]
MNTPIRLLTLGLLAAAATLGWPAAAVAEPTPTPTPTPTAVQTTVNYTCQAPVGGGTLTSARVSASLPTSAAVNQPLVVEWNIDAGLLAPETLPAGALIQRAAIKLSGAQSGTIATVSAPSTSALSKGQALALPVMKGSLTPTQSGSLTLTPGDLTIAITHNGSLQQTSCTADPAAAALATVNVGAAPTLTPTPTPTPTSSSTATARPTATVTVTATPTPTPSEAPAQIAVTPEGGAPTGGGGLAEPLVWPYAAAGVGVLFVIGIGLEIRRKRIHGY